MEQVLHGNLTSAGLWQNPQASRAPGGGVDVAEHGARSEAPGEA